MYVISVDYTIILTFYQGCFAYFIDFYAGKCYCIWCIVCSFFRSGDDNFAI